MPDRQVGHFKINAGIYPCGELNVASRRVSSGRLIVVSVAITCQMIFVGTFEWFNHMAD